MPKQNLSINISKCNRNSKQTKIHYEPDQAPTTSVAPSTTVSSAGLSTFVPTSSE